MGGATLGGPSGDLQLKFPVSELPIPMCSLFQAWTVSSAPWVGRDKGWSGAHRLEQVGLGAWRGPRGWRGVQEAWRG